MLLTPEPDTRPDLDWSEGDTDRAEWDVLGTDPVMADYDDDEEDEDLDFYDDDEDLEEDFDDDFDDMPSAIDDDDDEDDDDEL